MAKHRRKNSLPCGSNLIANALLRVFVFLLENKVDRIYKKRVLTEKLRGKIRPLAGIALSKRFDKTAEEETIFLSGAKTIHPTKDDLGQTLVHEMLHMLMPDVKEEFIQRLERSVWESFSPEQKQIIKSYIPKHTVKRKAE